MSLAFRLGGCRVRAGFSCFALLAFCCIFTGMEGAGACLLAVALHECAHLLVMAALGAPAGEVGLSALGCRITPSPGRPLSDPRQALVSLAGPAMNLLCFCLSYGLGAGGSAFAGASLALGLAHSLPIEPLDGGLALRYLLRPLLGDHRAELVCRTASVLLVFPLGVLGFLILLRTRYNYSLLALSLYLALYLVLGRDLAQP